MKQKKGVVATGLVTVILYISFVLLIIIFFFIFKLSFGETAVIIESRVSTTDANFQLISFLRSNVDVNGKQMSLAEFIALAENDNSKKDLLKSTAIAIMDKTYGEASCNLMCIGIEKYKSSGCGYAGNYVCSPSTIAVPSYDKKLIPLSLDLGSGPDILSIK